VLDDNGLDPDSAAQGAKLQVRLSGDNLDSSCKLLINGVVDGAGTPIAGEFGIDPFGNPIASLNISQDAAPGAYAIAVGNSHGISEAKYFFVFCAGCPAPPALEYLSTGHDEPGNDAPPVYQGETAVLTLGGYFLNNDPAVSISGGGLVLDGTAAYFTGIYQHLDQQVTVAPDAPTGRHTVTVKTSGGTSNPLYITVRTVPPPAPRITDVEVFKEFQTFTRCLRTGSNELYVEGNNLEHTFMKLAFVANDRAYLAELDQPDFQQLSKPFPTDIVKFIVPIDTVPPDDFSVRVESPTWSAPYAPFDAVCGNRPGSPFISSLSPDVVTQGTTVFIKFEGANLRQAELRVNDNAGVTIKEVLSPVAGQPDSIKIAKLEILPSANGDVLLWFKDQSGQASIPRALRILQPGLSYINAVTPDYIPQGTSTEVTVRGSKLVSASAVHFSSPGVSISNVQLDSSRAFMTCHIQADLTAALTNDTNTNLVAGNPLAFKVLPAGSQPPPPPTPTPTATATATPTPRPTSTPTATPTSTPTAAPVTLSSITPSHAMKGVTLYLKCQGNNFGTNRQVICDDPAISVTTNLSANGDPNHVVVAQIQVPSNLISSADGIRVKNLSTGFFNSQPINLIIDTRTSGLPFVDGGSAGSAKGSVHQGGAADIDYTGYNLDGATNASWGGIAGLTFTNTTVAVIPGDPAGLKHVLAHVVASSTAPQTIDEATNLRLTINGQNSNEFGFAVFGP
jgi:hypothetical protein